MLENLKEIHSDPCYYIDIKGNVYDAELKQVRPYIGNRGTYMVTLRKTLSKRKNRIDNKMPVTIGRLLLEHYVRKPNKNEVLSFIDGNPLNINISNLKWIDKNEVHAVKFSNDTILTIKNKLSEGISVKEITEEFDISHTHVYRIRRGFARNNLITN